jgi:hypothetical protein
LPQQHKAKNQNTSPEQSAYFRPGVDIIMSFDHSTGVFEDMLSSMIACNRALYPKSNPFVPEDFTPRYGSSKSFLCLLGFLFQLQYATSQSLKRKLKVAGSYDIPSANTGGMDGEFH